MKTQKAIISFSKTKDHELADIGQAIANKMTNNPNYPTPTLSISDLQAAITAYSSALIQAQDGSKADVVAKNASRTTLENDLSALGNYVNLIADGDALKLQSSGFPLTKLPEPIGILDAPILTVHYGENAGEMAIEISPIPKASGYIVLYAVVPAPADNNDWSSKTMSSSKATLTHLKSGNKYVYKAAALSSEANKMNIYNFSTPIEKIVP
ncbi:MAG: hypothetical protein D0531_02345 [Methylococcales bacterium]|nr:MAG: hypothetical protein D0531_02345 [Methylococcales bacterium]